MLNLRKNANQSDNIVKEIIDFLTNAHQQLQGRIPEESMDTALSESLQRWIVRYRDGLIVAGQNSVSMKDALRKATNQLNVEQNIFIDTLPIETVVDEIFPDPPREQTSEMTSMTPEEARFVNEYSSDKIWLMSYDPNYENTREQELAKSVISKGIIANNLKCLFKYSQEFNLSDSLSPETLTQLAFDPDTPPEIIHQIVAHPNTPLEIVNLLLRDNPPQIIFDN